MKRNEETSQQQLSSVSPSCVSPGSLTDAPCAESTSCLEEDTDMEKDGVLTSEIAGSGLSHLGISGNGRHYVYCVLSLPNHNLRDVSVLCNYVHLQKLELPHNKIKDLSCVSHMPYLVILNVSHNEISTFFEFQPPKNLTEVNLSHNCITKMKDLAAYFALTKLDLDYNSLSEICGLQQCCRLRHLSLAHNKISRISGLDGLPLAHLCLRGNQLERIEGLEHLKNLQSLDLSQNRITSLSGLQNLHLVGFINLEKNLVAEIEECKHIHNLLQLRDLNLLGNPMEEQPDYRLAVIFLLQHLTVLDQEKVTAEEKVSAVNEYDPPLEVVAARDHMTHLVYELMQPQVLYDSTLPSADSPYPMLVLTGPQCCGKRELAHRLCQELSEYFAYGTCHTTRSPYFGEEDGIDYYFVSEQDFQTMIHMGKFVQTMKYGGHNYGLTRDAIEDVARKGLGCCVHMELEGVFSLKMSCFQPRYILLIPTQVGKYTDHLKSRGLYSEAQIDFAVSRIELYANTNKQHPGFFDNVIPSDDWEEAYQTLRQVVREYLLLEEPEDRQNNRTSLDNLSTALHQQPEEKPSSPLSMSGMGAHVSPSTTALNPSEPSYRSHFSRIQAELSPQKSLVELASIKKREQLVREAIVGKRPGVYSQLFNSSAQTAPSSLNNRDPGTHYDQDSRSDTSRASSALSVPSSAGASSASVEPLDISVLGQTLDTLKDNMTSDQMPDAPHPGTGHPATVASPSSDRRPGSNVKPILPPIPTGRKTPVAPSPIPSPRPSSNPTVEEGAGASTEG